MRSEETFLNDLMSMPSFQWNSELASEFNFDLRALIIAMNDYNYSQPSERTIHGSGRLKNTNPQGTDSNKVVSEIIAESDSVIDDPRKISAVISSIRRGFSNLVADYGKCFRSYMIFGVDFESTDFPGVVLDGCVFSNCTFKDCTFPNGMFSSGKFSDCLFTRCDFSGAKMSKFSMFGVSFVDCDLEGSNFSDCVLHMVSFYNCEMDDVDILNGGLHRVDIESCSVKRSSIFATIVSASKFVNSNFKATQLVNNRFVGSKFDKLHLDNAVQVANGYLGCKIDSSIEEFFMETEYEYEDGEPEESAESELREKSFDEIMNGDDEDDDEDGQRSG